MSTTFAKPVSRPWRRFLRFSVRGLIIVVLLIAGWLGWIVHGARIQHEAVAAIIKDRGRIEYDWESHSGCFSAAGTPWAPRWLTEQMGIDYFGHVTSVVLNSETNTTIAHVGRLNRLQRLELSHMGGHLAHLSGLTKLTELQLKDTRLTDAGMAQLKQVLPLSDIHPCGAAFQRAAQIDILPKP